MKEEESAKQQDVELEKEEVNPINNITNMIINKIICDEEGGACQAPR